MNDETVESVATAEIEQPGDAAGDVDEVVEIHLPEPSIAPLLVAAGMTLILTGLLWPVLLFLGLIALAAGIGIWALGK
mgnify:CR=1 FL=1